MAWTHGRGDWGGWRWLARALELLQRPRHRRSPGSKSAKALLMHLGSAKVLLMHLGSAKALLMHLDSA